MRSHDVRCASCHREYPRPEGRAGRHCEGADPNRSRRQKPAVAIPVRHRHRPQRAVQIPVQRARHMRSFMKFPEDSIAVYLDWRTQEIGVAAARSGDAQLAEDYSAGDIYHALALMCGLTNDANIKRWKSGEQCATSADEGVAAGHQLRHGRPLVVERPRPASADRQRGSHPSQATLPDGFGSGALAWSNEPC